MLFRVLTVFLLILQLIIVDAQDSYQLYLTKVFIKTSCTKEGHSNVSHCLKCIMKAFKSSKELQQEIGICVEGNIQKIQECFKDKRQAKEIDRCLIDKQQRINCYGIGIRKLAATSFVIDENKMKTGILKCQEEPDFLECMDTNAVAPRIFSETFHRCRVGKLTRLCLHKEYPGIDVDNFTYAMRVCPGVLDLTVCLHENLKDYPKCHLKF